MKRSHLSIALAFSAIGLSSFSLANDVLDSNPTQAASAVVDAISPIESAPTGSKSAMPTSSKDITLTGRKEVAYQCGGSGKNNLNVMYGFVGDQVAVAQVKYQNIISPILYRDSKVKNSNTFRSNNIIWVTQSTNANNIATANGIRLAQPIEKKVKGKNTISEQIVTSNCNVDQTATAALPLLPAS